MRSLQALVALLVVLQVVDSFRRLPTVVRIGTFKRQQNQLLQLGASTEEETPVSKMPSRDEFSAYYEKTVEAGEEMRLDQVMRYGSVAKLLDDGTVLPEDLNNLWISAVGDAVGLNVDEGYELICMINDLPDPEDAEFYDKEFGKLTGDVEGAKLPFFKFVNWADVQDMMNEGVLSMEEVTQIWRDNAGDLNASIDRTTFGKINMAMDDAIETKEMAEDTGVSAAAGPPPSAPTADSLPPGSTPSFTESSQDSDTIDVTDLDVWGPSFDPMTAFDPENMEEITAYFTKTAGGLDKKMSFDMFRVWDDVKELLDEKVMTPQILQATWEEAAKGEAVITYDTFLRLNVKLDLVMDELEAAAAIGGGREEMDEAESFYRDEFKRISGGGPLIRVDMLLEWKEVKELIDDGSVSQKQIERMFEGMPKEPMGIPANAFGINEDTFVAFNGMLDVVLDASGGGSGDVSPGVTPSSLVSEPARPMPTQSELKLGDLSDPGGPANAMGVMEDNPDTGLSQSELEEMETLDKADNMLTGGDFGDFDRLIDDVDDPRLAALREKNKGATDIQGQLQEILDELVNMCRDQTRCGLDKPEEEDQARMRDLVQSVTEKAGPAAARDVDDLRKAINGKWRLLYTNSEMFSFYNGVTGFANVFPTTKFEDLAMQYISDGYISESRYYETLSSPLGEIPCTVYSNWEVVKEMSFMTNANSVVLRNYCSKVTAGPMEYLAEENWKSLRTMSMNELIYVDDKIKIMRNTGALRIFFVYLKED